MLQIKILIIRRDNIGDLICTTPLFTALRQRYPHAYIAALVNSYNAPAIQGNPDLDAIFAYTKGKHADGESVLGAHWRRLRLLWRLRQEKFDYVILPMGGFAKRALELARWLAPKHIIGFVTPEQHPAAINVPIAYGDSAASQYHETEDIFRLLAPLITPSLSSAKTSQPEVNIPPATVIPDPTLLAKIRASLPSTVLTPADLPAHSPLIALHLSARKPLQRWPIENFAALARELHRQYQARFLVFWSPGDENNPFHPGDDGKAAKLLTMLADLPVAAVRTEQLGELIAGLSLADVAILSDGGAMHVAAGLGKPIVCFFGNSPAQRWHPWGVPYELLQPNSRDVRDIDVATTLAAFARLWGTSQG